MSGVLLTGFEPFDGSPTNASWEAVERATQLWDTHPAWGQTPALDGVAIPTLETLLLPVEFDTAAALLVSHTATYQPKLVISTGVNAGSSTVALERLAVNLRDARIADASGHQPIDVTIDAQAPAARWSSLPLRHIAASLDAAHIPHSLSMTAGTYVCNDVFFALMGIASRLGMTAGFIHVPASPSMNTTGPTMPTALVADALVRACATAWTTAAMHRPSASPSQ